MSTLSPYLPLPPPSITLKIKLEEKIPVLCQPFARIIIFQIVVLIKK